MNNLINVSVYTLAFLHLHTHTHIPKHNKYYYNDPTLIEHIKVIRNIKTKYNNQPTQRLKLKQTKYEHTLLINKISKIY